MYNLLKTTINFKQGFPVRKKQHFINKILSIWETPTLLACADSSTDKSKCRLFVYSVLHFWALYSHFCCIFGPFYDFSGKSDEEQKELAGQ